MMRVRWTDEERAILIEQAAQLTHAKQAFSLRDALIKAQEILPKDRRRTIAALSQVSWFIESVPPKIKDIERRAIDASKQEVQQFAQSAEQLAKERLEEQIATFLARILAKAIKSATEDPALSNLLFPVINHEPQKHRLVSQRREKLRRVIVAGLLNSQAKVVESEFKDRLDIRFWSKDQSADTLKNMLSHADAAIGLVSFLAHSHDAVLKSSKVPYTPVSGGVTQIKQALEKLAW